jgi:flavin reductase (DIM6/NTAB) family NADH-FMN oxidoreductase RutF
MKKSIGAKPLVYPAPVFVIGTYTSEGKPNVMTASWAGICCSDPPCISVSLRKATYTYGLIKSAGAFTISVPSERYAREADYFGSVSGRKTDKFADTGLTPVKSNLVNAPYVKEFPMVLECTVIHIYEIGLHTQFIGRIEDIKVDDMVLDVEGKPNIKNVNPFVYAPGRGGYYTIGNRIGSAYKIGDEFKKRE